MANTLSTLFGEIADAIRTKTGGTDAIAPADFPDAIQGITVGSGGSSGESDLVTYVDVYTEDGAELLYSMPVLIGDDAKDPVATGAMDTPAKESDEYNHYVYSGYSLTPGGEADSSALKNVTERRSVYLAFTASTRYYTVTYLDSDETTVLSTEQYAYGADGSKYTPTKDGYIFSSWLPDVSSVTADISTVAQWDEGYVFNSTSWAKIAELSESGEISKHFSVGDKKFFAVTKDGTETTVYCRILGFGHDDLADGSGKAGVTIGVYRNWPYTCINRSNLWPDSTIKKHTDNTAMSYLPEDLAAVIKSVTKKYALNFAQSTQTDASYYGSCSAKIWSLAAAEMGCGVYLGEGSVYDYYKGDDLYRSTGKNYTIWATGEEYHIRTPDAVADLRTSMYVNSSGMMYSNGNNRVERPSICFCI